jgi:YVTN family beta-propeller protein
MIRQAVFWALLALAHPGYPGASPAGQTQTPEPSPRPVAEMPLSRLKADATLPIAIEPGAVATGDAIWVRSRAAGTVTRIAPKDNTIGAPVAVGADPCASLVIAFESLWVPLCGDGLIARVDTKGAEVTARAGVGAAAADGGIAAAAGSIWVVTDRKGVLARVDPGTNLPVAEVFLPRGPVAVVAGTDALWVTSEDAGRLARVNPHSTEVEEIVAVGPKPGRLAVGEGGVWTLNRGDGSVSRVDPKTNKVVATIAIGPDAAAGDIAAGAGSVWVSAPGVPIVRIDPRTNLVVQRFTGDGGGAVLVAHGSIWVAAGAQVTWRLDPQLVAAVRP